MVTTFKWLPRSRVPSRLTRRKAQPVKRPELAVGAAPVLVVVPLAFVDITVSCGSVSCGRSTGSIRGGSGPVAQPRNYCDVAEAGHGEEVTMRRRVKEIEAGSESLEVHDAKERAAA